MMALCRFSRRVLKKNDGYSQPSYFAVSLSDKTRKKHTDEGSIVHRKIWFMKSQYYPRFRLNPGLAGVHCQSTESVRITKTSYHNLPPVFAGHSSHGLPQPLPTVLQQISNVTGPFIASSQRSLVILVQQ